MSPEDPSTPPDLGEVEAVLAAVAAYPLHRNFGFRLEHAADGRCRAGFRVEAGQLNLGGVVHGGVWYTLLDVTAFCATVTALPPGIRAASTVDLHVQVLEAGHPGDDVELEGRVLRVGRRLAFSEAEARIDGRIVATARLTKALLGSREH